jgi:hypothetical protein
MLRTLRVLTSMRTMLDYTEGMPWRARPLLPRLVPCERLEAAVRGFCLEINRAPYVAEMRAQNVAASLSVHASSGQLF